MDTSVPLISQCLWHNQNYPGFEQPTSLSKIKRANKNTQPKQNHKY